ncbi:hypothetical protein LINGRAHAP2_LOCUS14260 [Linum grandiflorum]
MFGNTLPRLRLMILIR